MDCLMHMLSYGPVDGEEQGFNETKITSPLQIASKSTKKTVQSQVKPRTKSMQSNVPNCGWDHVTCGHLSWTPFSYFQGLSMLLQASGKGHPLLPLFGCVKKAGIGRNQQTLVVCVYFQFPWEWNNVIMHNSDL